MGTPDGLPLRLLDRINLADIHSRNEKPSLHVGRLRRGWLIVQSVFRTFALSDAIMVGFGISIAITGLILGTGIALWLLTAVSAAAAVPLVVLVYALFVPGIRRRRISKYLDGNPAGVGLFGLRMLLHEGLSRGVDEPMPIGLPHTVGWSAQLLSDDHRDQALRQRILALDIDDLSEGGGERARAIDRAYATVPIRYTDRGTDRDHAYFRENITTVALKYGNVWRYDHTGRISLPVGTRAAVPDYLSAVPASRMDAVNGDVATLRNTAIRAMWSSAAFQRLIHIRQLSSVAQITHLDGTHSRLAHSFGVVDLAALVLDRVWSASSGTGGESDAASWFDSHAQTREEIAVAFLIAAGVHDLFHGPLGHVLDSSAELLYGRRAAGKKVDKLELRRQVRTGLSALEPPGNRSVEDPTDHALLDVVQACTRAGGVRSGDLDTKTVFVFVASILRDQSYDPDDSGMESEYGRYTANVLSVLAQMIDYRTRIGDTPVPWVDIDRLDYLFRDCHHVGWSDRIPPVNQVIENCDIRFTDDTFSVRFADADVERLNAARAQNYEQLYYSKEKQGFDAMVQRALYWLLHTETSATKGNQDNRDLPVDTGLRSSVMSLTDMGLIHLFYELSGKRRHTIPWHLMNRALLGRPFECIYDHRDETSAVQAAIEATREDQDEDDPERFTRVWADRIEATRGVPSRTSMAATVAMFVLKARPSILWSFEIALWKRVVARADQFTRAEELLRALYGHRTAPAAQDARFEREVKRAVMDYPMVFVVAPWEFGAMSTHGRRPATPEMSVLRFFAPSETPGLRDAIVDMLDDGTLAADATYSDDGNDSGP
jgi:HD superfamily phosphohydrolase